MSEGQEGRVILFVVLFGVFVVGEREWLRVGGWGDMGYYLLKE